MQGLVGAEARLGALQANVLTCGQAPQSRCSLADAASKQPALLQAVSDVLLAVPDAEVSLTEALVLSSRLRAVLALDVQVWRLWYTYVSGVLRPDLEFQGSGCTITVLRSCPLTMRS